MTPPPIPPLHLAEVHQMADLRAVSDLFAAVWGRGDEGVPIVAGDPGRPAAKALDGLAELLAGRKRDLAGRKLELHVNG